MTLKPTSSLSSSKLLSSRPTFLTPYLTYPSGNPTGITHSECSKLSSQFLPLSLPVSTARSLTEVFLKESLRKHRPRWPSQKTAITLNSSSFSHSSYPTIHEALSADLPLQYHSGLFISPSQNFTPVYAMTVEYLHLDGHTASVFLLPPAPPPQVHCLHCSQGGLSSVQICLLASLSNIFYCYPTGSKDKA